MAERGYRRSWRNLILDTEYQLVFTTAMVLSALLFMAGLGYVVLDMANTSTKTAIADVQGQPFLAPEVADETIAGIRRRQALLEGVLVGVGVLVTGGLFVYGIKATHKVAGPLHKVGLYCEQLAAGRFETPRNLRKGDQLVEFYEHFKEAHAGIVTRERDDIARLNAIIAAAEEAGLGDHDATKQLRELIARKEKSLE